MAFPVILLGLSSPGYGLRTPCWNYLSTALRCLMEEGQYLNEIKSGKTLVIPVTYCFYINITMWLNQWRPAWSLTKKMPLELHRSEGLVVIKSVSFMRMAAKQMLKGRKRNSSVRIRNARKVSMDSGRGRDMAGQERWWWQACSFPHRKRGIW